VPLQQFLWQRHLNHIHSFVPKSLSCAVFQSDVADSEDTASQSTEENSAEVGVGCEAESSRDSAQKSSAASETTTQQTKPKKLNKKQLLAEQRRKDRVRAEIFVVAHIQYAATLRWSWSYI